MGPDADRSALEQQLKFKIDISLEEYKALRTEIVATLSSSHVTTNLTITASGILIAGSSAIIQNQAIHLFLWASYAFYLIAWIQLRYVLAVANISEHISEVLAPIVREALVGLSPSPEIRGEAEKLLTWDVRGRARNHSLAWALPIEGARYLFPISSAIASAIAFLIILSRSPSSETQQYWFWGGAASTFILLFYTCFLTLKVRSRATNPEPNNQMSSFR
jgi:hypothetical protein